MPKIVRRLYGKTHSYKAALALTLAEPILISTILDMTDEDIAREVGELRATITSAEERKRREAGGHGGLIPTPGEVSARRIGERMQRYRLDQLLLAQQIRRLNARLDGD